MANLGSLVVSLEANTAEFESALTRAEQSARMNMGQIERAAGNAASAIKSMLGVLGVSLGASMFVEMVKGSIDAADHMNDLSKTTGIAVEQLSGLRMAARMSGGDLDSIAASVNKLSVNMGKHAEKFAALGVTAKDPLKAFQQLSDVFIAIQDPQQRAAVMAEALGKSWAGAAPLLAEGGNKIGEMVAKGAQLSGMNKELATRSDEFNDKMKELSTTLEGTRNKLVGDMLPGLIKISAAMQEAAKDGGLLKAVLVGVGGVMVESFKPIQVLALGFNNTLDEANAKLMRFFGQKAESDKLLAAVAARNKEILAIVEENDTVIKSTEGLTDAQKKAAADAAAKAAEFLELAKEKADAYDRIKKHAEDYIKTLEKETAQAGLDVIQKKMVEASLISLTLHKGKERDAVMQAALAWAQATRIAEDAKTAQDALVASIKATNDAHYEAGKFIDRVSTAAAEYVKQLEFENSLLGKNTLETQLLTDKRRIELALEKELLALRDNDKFKTRNSSTGVNIEYQAAIDAAIKSAEATKAGAEIEINARAKVMRSWEFGSSEAIRKYLDEVTNAAAQSERLFTNAFKNMEDALVKFVRTGKLDFKSLADGIINDLIRIQVQQSIMAPLAGAMQSSGGLGGLLSGMFGGGQKQGLAAMDQSAPIMSTASAAGGYDIPAGVNPMTQLHQSEMVLPAEQANVIRDLARGNGSNTPNVVVQVINQSGQAVTAKQQGGPQFDGKDWVLGVVLEAADSNPHFRNAMGMAR